MSGKYGQVAFIGLGLGYPCRPSGQASQRSYSVQSHLGEGVSVAGDYRDSPSLASATSPRAAATDAGIVFVCVGNDEDVAEVVLGQEGALAGMSPGSLLIDHTTASQALAQKLGAACKAQSVGFLDAPVSGGQAGAENGALTVMTGGLWRLRARWPILHCYAKKHALMGDIGAGQLMKMGTDILRGIAGA